MTALNGEKLTQEVDTPRAVEHAQVVIEEVLGAVAQSGERLVCNQEVVGSIPIGSTP